MNGFAVKKSYANLFERHSIQEEEAEVWQYTILQKAAKSTCIVKNTYLLGKVMDAKKKECINLYFSKLCCFFVYYFLNTK
jgi:hypothetical protein